MVRRLQAFIALLLTLAYFGYVFQVSGSSFWHSGVGDWGDPNFINVLLEHWYQSVRTLTSPASPPMYFPATGTLGYSHGLILYAPFYAAARLAVDPFHAHNVTLLLVLITGSVALYLLLRSVPRLGFVEALLLTAFFATSRNVINGTTAIWSQTASVFLVPPILLMARAAATMQPGPQRTILSGASGLLFTLLLTQEFYTGLFVLFFAAVAGAAYLFVGRQPSIPAQMFRFWKEEPRRLARFAVAAAALSAVWTIALIMSGGGIVHLFGFAIASRDWRRPAVIGLAALAVLVHLRGRPRLLVDLSGHRSWMRAFGAGALLGCGVFLWIYLPAYREHPGFAQDELLRSLIAHDRGRWRGVDFIEALGVYDTLRPFRFALLGAGMACLPLMGLDARVRRYSAWFLLLSLIVLLIPIRFDSVSVWTLLFAPFPGFAAIRDPRRIIHVYELTLVLLTALFLASLPSRSRLRLALCAALVYWMVTDWNREVFGFARPVSDYERWVDAPIAIEPECRSFFVRAASDVYASRWDNPWVLYNVEATFVALRHGIPTLNGYSAWFPEGWRLFHPADRGYVDAVKNWSTLHALSGVCEFDIEKRTMTPF